MGSKVLIAGGAGFIGSTIASACLDAGITPVILDNLSTGREEFARERILYTGDIADGDLVDRIFRDHPDIGVVVHAAGLIVVPESALNPLRYYRENVAKSIDFLDHLIRNGCSRILFSSSASVYKPGPDFSVDESSAIHPQSPYARTKAMVEWVLADCAHAHDLRVISLRYFNPIGADPKLRTGMQVPQPTHVLGKLFEAATTDGEFQITGTEWPTRDGTGIRDYVHVWDLAQAHVQAIRRFDDVLPEVGPARFEVINLGTGRGVTVRELAAAFQRVLGRSLRMRDAPARPGDVIGSFARCDRAHDVLDWKASLTLEDGLRDSVSWFRTRDTVIASEPNRKPASRAAR